MSHDERIEAEYQRDRQQRLGIVQRITEAWGLKQKRKKKMTDQAEIDSHEKD